MRVVVMKTVVKFSIASLFVATSLGGAFAQSIPVDNATLLQRIEQLENDLAVLRGNTPPGVNVVSGTEGAPQSMVPVGSQAVAQLSVRMDQLEYEMRQLTGTLEQVNHKTDQLNRELGSLSEDTDYRLRAVESGQPINANGPAITPISPSQSVEPQSLGTIPLSALGGDSKDQYDSALSYLKQGEHEQAEAALKQFLTDHEDNDLAGNAQYWLGESYYVRQMYREAATAFLDGVRKYPDGSKAPDSMLKLGMSLNALGQTKEACTTLSEISRRYPSASQTIQQRAKIERTRAGCS